MWIRQPAGNTNADEPRFAPDGTMRTRNIDWPLPNECAEFGPPVFTNMSASPRATRYAVIRPLPSPPYWPPTMIVSGIWNVSSILLFLGTTIYIYKHSSQAQSLRGPSQKVRH